MIWGASETQNSQRNSQTILKQLEEEKLREQFIDRGCDKETVACLGQKNGQIDGIARMIPAGRK